MTSRLFLDWALRKKIYYTLEGRMWVKAADSVEELPRADEVYMEEGAPLSLTAKLLSRYKVFVIHGHEVGKFREVYGIEKADNKDPILLYLIWRDHPDAFREFAAPEKKEVIRRYYGRLLRSYIRTSAEIMNRLISFMRQYSGGDPDTEIEQLKEITD